MECPHCQQELPRRTCPHCRAGLLDTGPYCSYCGKGLQTSQAGGATDTPPAADNDVIDWDQRTLCSDESCIGVLGPDGRCKECGKPYAESAAAG
jgi:hypothetical protein